MSQKKSLNSNWIDKWDKIWNDEYKKNYGSPSGDGWKTAEEIAKDLGITSDAAHSAAKRRGWDKEIYCINGRKRTFFRPKA